MTRSLTVDVVEAVAEAEGVDHADLGYVLEDHIDTDALERLAARAATPWTLSFELPGHEVTVASDGRIAVDGVEMSDVPMEQYRNDRRSAPLTAD